MSIIQEALRKAQQITSGHSNASAQAGGSADKKEAAKNIPDNPRKDAPGNMKAAIVITDIKSAEIIKHASNSFLAVKISFINSIANICDRVGADVGDVARGMGLDKRISKDFLNAGIGFGGSCFPKDMSAFLHISEKLGVRFELLADVLRINDSQPKYFVKKIKTVLKSLKGKTIGVLGLAFKPDTDDMR